MLTIPRERDRRLAARRLAACIALLLLVAACDRTGMRINQRRVGIYGAVFDAVFRAELGDLPGTPSTR